MTVIRLGLCLAMAFAVAAHGAVEPWSEFILLAVLAGLLLLWGLMAVTRSTLRLHWNPLLAPLLALGAIGLAQLLLGFSAYPYATKAELLRLTIYLFAFFLAVQVFRTAQECKLLVWFLLVLGFATALFGIIQHLTFNGKLYWVRELRLEAYPFGPYVNRNHFAGLMELMIPLGMACIFLRGVRRDQLPLVSLFTLVPVGGLFLSASRGGILAFALQFVFLTVLVWVALRGKKKLALALVFVAVGGAFLLWLDPAPALRRLTEIGTEEISRSRRLMIARDTWEIFLDHPVAGTGLGTFEQVYPQYESYYDGKVIEHAHNDYLELLAESGGLGGLCALVFLWLLFRRAWARLQEDHFAFALATRIGCLVACAGVLLHDLVDFNLRLPSHALLFSVLAAVATAPLTTSLPPPPPAPVNPWGAAA